MHERHRDVCNCGDCAFWKHLNDSDGDCRLHAPCPSDSLDEVTHWPRTRAEQGCGDGRIKDDTALMPVACAACIYWRHPIEGLHPINVRDQLSEWWSQAGRCVRHSPRPSPEPGSRAFWRATHANDSCFEGKTKGR